VLNGLIKPDHGRVTMRGRVGALIALGAGFNPILSGRENIYVNASVLGLTKREIDEKIEGIIDFSEIRDFIDAPVQSYSSGMNVRLGFAVASSLSPDILLVDEVLAVGDLAFRAKCFRRIDELRRNAAVILVSHQMDQISVACNRVVVMDHGRMVCDGTAEAGIEAYERLNDGGNVEGDKEVRRIAPPLTRVDLEVPEQFSYGEAFRAVLNVATTEPIPDFYMRVRLRGPDATLALDITSIETLVRLPAGQYRVEISSERLFLRSGSYTVSVDGFRVSQLEPMFYLSRIYRTRIVANIRFRGDNHVHLPAVLRLEAIPDDRAVELGGKRT
jgi:lipopolysaccharide transport system ATP-binding protein